MLEKDSITLVFKNVPAQICDNFGEEYLSADANKKLLEKATDAAKRGADLQLLKYAA